MDDAKKVTINRCTDFGLGQNKCCVHPIANATRHACKSKSDIDLLDK